LSELVGGARDVDAVGAEVDRAAVPAGGLEVNAELGVEL